jgi:hypothetical protein
MFNGNWKKILWKWKCNWRYARQCCDYQGAKYLVKNR